MKVCRLEGNFNFSECYEEGGRVVDFDCFIVRFDNFEKI